MKRQLRIPPTVVANFKRHPPKMNQVNYKIAFLFLLILCLGISCAKTKETICQFRTSEFDRDLDTLSRYMLTDMHIKYNVINDSTVIILSITDSLKTWNSNRKYDFRDTIGIGKFYGNKHDSIISIIDSVYENMDMKRFNEINITPKTIIIVLNPVNENDTLRYEGEKKYGNSKVYSFYYRFHGHDGDSRLYLSDDIGEIAFYSGAWNNITILDKIYNSESMDKKWQKLKKDLLKDSLFFPIPLEFIRHKTRIYYTPPTIIE